MRRRIRKFLWFSISTCAFWLTIAQLAAAAPDQPVRVALMDFSVDDLSFRSAQAASDFTTLLQASWPPESEIAWVEREQLAKAAAELELAGAGLSERAEAARAGYWSHADWTVFGSISTNRPGLPRHLRVEVIDLSHAVSLGETELVLSSIVPGPFTISTNDIESAARTLGPWLNQKAQAWRIENSKRAIAYLGCSTASTWLADAVRQSGARWLDFKRAGRSTTEAELSLAGLVQADSKAWSKVADLYVWDESSQPQSLDALAPLRSDQSLQSQTYSIIVWAPGGKPKVIANVTGQAPPADQRVRIAHLLADELKSAPKISPSQEIRTELVARFSGNALARQVRQHVSSLADSRARLDWLQQVQILETALFLDPADQFTRELWLRTRWAGPLSDEFRSPFNYQRFRFDAWGEYLDQFQTNRLGTNVWTAYGDPNSSIAAEFFDAADQALQYARRDSAKHEVGIPDDVAGPVMRAWQRHFRDGIRRRAGWLLNDPGVSRYSALLVGALVDDLDGLDSKRAADRATLCDRMATRLGTDYSWSRWVQDYRQPIASLYELAGRGPAGRTLLETAAQVVSKARIQREQEARSAAVPVQLPRAEVMDESPSDEWLSTAGVSFAPPLLEARSEAVRFPAEFHPTRVLSLTAFGGRVWAVVKGREARNVMAADPALGQQIRTMPNVQSFTVWSAADADTVATPAPAPAPHVQSDFDSSAPWLSALTGELWAGDGHSLVHWLPTSSTFEPVDRSLLPANSAFLAAADVGPWRYVLGGPGICRSPLTGGNWTSERMAYSLSDGSFVSSGSRFIFLGNSPLLFNSAAVFWMRPSDLSVTLKNAGGLTLRNSLASAGEGAFWAATHCGIYRLETNDSLSTVYRFQRPPTVKKASSLSALPASHPAGPAPAGTSAFSAQDSLALWEPILARSAAKGANRWTRISETPRLVLADGEFLWGVFGFGRIGLLHPGTTNWVGILQTTVPASVHCMAVTDEALWLGLDGGDIPLLRIPKKHLLSVPHERWVAEAISAEDIAAAGSGRPPTAQGVLALFSGNAGRVRDLLEAIPETDLTAEQRFLLALAYDECGLNEPSNRLRNENALLQDFPASIYSRVLKYEQIRRRVTGQPAGPNSFATPASDTTNTTLTAALEFARKIVAAYDLNGDGALDQEELAVAARLEPRSLSLQDVPASAADAWLLANNTLMSCQIFAGANLALRGRVDANMLAAWWQFRANPRSRVGLRPVNLRRPFDSNSMPPAVHQPSFRVNPATNNSLSGASRL